MNKKIAVLFFLNIYLYSFAIIGTNSYRDVNIIDKDGTFALGTFHRDNSMMFFGGVGTDGYAEGLIKYRMNIDSPELFGMMIVGDIFVGMCKDRDIGFEFNKFAGITFYCNEGYIGYQNKYTSIKLGFQNIVSSDAIYNHLLIDDNGGSFFTLRFDQFMSRFVDMENGFIFIRPHNGEWSPNFSSLYRQSEQFGKSLFYKKFNIRPLPWIRIGLGDGVYFLGNNFNPYFCNPLLIYFMALASSPFWESKYGATPSVSGSSLKIDLDFNIGFDGWRFYGEMLIDDSDGFFVTMKRPIFPNRVAFLLGGELRGCLFTKYIHLSKPAQFFLGNLYINFEYGVTSKYCYTRDDEFNYEYVRQEYRNIYDPKNPISSTELAKIQRTGNFIGFMYGNNADCFDMAIGWRNDLPQVQSFTAGYKNDVYFDSFTTKKEIDRLFKVQLHYRHYRLGDERNVCMPFYANEHYYYDCDPDLDTDGDGNKTNDTSNRETEFLRVVTECGDIFDICLYSDLFRVTRFNFGIDTKFTFFWQTYHPMTVVASTDFTFKWEIAFNITWH